MSFVPRSASNNAHANRPSKVNRLGCKGYLQRMMGNVMQLDFGEDTTETISATDRINVENAIEPNYSTRSRSRSDRISQMGFITTRCLLPIPNANYGICCIKPVYLERLGSLTLGKLSKLRRTQSIPTSLLSLIF